MMLGMSLAQFTLFHTAISLVAIVAGVAFFFGVARGRWSRTVNAVFLLFTVLTSVTGFLFPPKPIGPPFIFGVISLALLAVALYALHGRKAVGGWRGVYLGTALVAQWLNMIVLIVQSFQKIPALNALAPNGNEPPVLVAQVLLLAAIAWTGWTTVWKGHPVASSAAQ